MRIRESVDGRSLVPLLRRDAPPVESWRQALLLEHGFLQTGDVGRTPANVSNAVEPPDAFDLAGPMMPQPFQGLHTNNLAYVEYPSTGERELYNLDDDPYEQTSIADSDPELADQLAAWLQRLSTWRGASCRVAENTPPCDLNRSCSEAIRRSALKK